jgi:hypothetical protein
MTSIPRRPDDNPVARVEGPGPNHRPIQQAPDGSDNPSDRIAMTSGESARKFINRGWSVVPVLPKSKRPVAEAWQHLRIVADDVDRYFPGEENVGVLLGEPSNGLTDIDLDANEAVRLAPEFLPTTPCRFGRAGKQSSHWLYQVHSAVKTTRFEDPDQTDASRTAMLLELRSTGTQTVVPPSTHPSGEPIEWDTDNEPATVAAEDLVAAVHRLAIAAALGRHWPAQGARHEAALAAAGLLLRGELDADLVTRIITGAARVAGDAEWHERERDVRDTASRLAEGRPVTAGRRLPDLLAGNGMLVVQRLTKWIAILTGQVAVGSAHRPKISQAQQLVAIADTADLFLDSDGDTAFATVLVNGHHETWPIKRRQFRLWLARALYEDEGKPPRAQALTEALTTIEAQARFGGHSHTVHLRVAGHRDEIYVDLGNPAHEAVKITSTGWEVIADPPVKFRRTRGMQALPTPTRGGSLNELWRFMNLNSADRPLVAGTLVMAFNPKGPYPIVVLHGGHGSAKTTAARVMRRLIDPNVSDLRAEPREIRDLAIASANGWYIALDNLSTVPAWLSDALCRLSTGAGFATRELYSDLEETIIEAQRPVILTGIEELVTKPDLLSRSIIVYLPEMPEDRRREEREFWADFEAARPALLGVFLEAVSTALNNLSSVRLGRLPRMADFARWAVAAEPALGFNPGVFMKAYAGAIAFGHELAIEASPVAAHVQALAGVGWQGTAAELLQILNERTDDATRKNRDWPKSPKGASNALRRIQANLGAVGVAVDFQDVHGLGRRRRQITLMRRGAGTHRSDGSERSDGPGDRPVDRSGDDVDGAVNGPGSDGTPCQNGPNDLASASSANAGVRDGQPEVDAAVNGSDCWGQQSAQPALPVQDA